MKKDENSTYNTPLYHALVRYVKHGYTPFHMPGHKQGKGFPADFLKNASQIDLTELPGLDDLRYPAGAIMDAQRLAARVFRAEHSYFLVNGSSAGILSSIMTICKPGQKLIIQRDSHSSVVNGLILAGAEPVFIQGGYNRKFGISAAVEADALEEAIKLSPDAAGVVLTRPTYYGVCSDLETMVKIAHRHGKPVVVDEAHGAHLGFAKFLPESAMDLGSDISIQSTHKTLPALTQTAILHSSGDIVNTDRLEYFLRLFQTTSPSYLLMASIDICRAIMETDGERLLKNLEGYLGDLAKGWENSGSVHLLQTKDLAAGARQDMTRLVFNFGETQLSGFQAGRMLMDEYGIQAEMSDLYNVVFIASIADRKKDIDKLDQSLHKMSGSLKQRSGVINEMPDLPPIPDRKFPLRKTIDLEMHKALLKNSKGMTAATMLTPYPPGIPLVWPGEEISGEAVAYLEAIAGQGGKVNGMTDDMQVDVL